MEWRLIDSLRTRLNALPVLTTGDVKVALMKAFHQDGGTRREGELEIVLAVRLMQSLTDQHEELTEGSILLVSTERKIEDEAVPVYLHGVGWNTIPASTPVALVPIERPSTSLRDFVVERIGADKVGPPLPGKDDISVRMDAIRAVRCPPYTEEYFTVDGLRDYDLWLLVAEYFARSGAVVELGESIYAGSVQYGSVDESIIPHPYLVTSAVWSYGQLSICISQG